VAAIGGNTIHRIEVERRTEIALRPIGSAVLRVATLLLIVNEVHAIRLEGKAAVLVARDQVE
jgi:hypothetical protein